MRQFFKANGPWGNFFKKNCLQICARGVGVQNFRSLWFFVCSWSVTQTNIYTNRYIYIYEQIHKLHYRLRASRGFHYVNISWKRLWPYELVIETHHPRFATRFSSSNNVSWRCFGCIRVILVWNRSFNDWCFNLKSCLIRYQIKIVSWLSVKIALTSFVIWMLTKISFKGMQVVWG